MTNVAAFYLDHPWRLALNLAFLVLLWVTDGLDAEWLPPWRRYVPALLWSVAWAHAVAFGDLHRVTADDVVVLVAALFSFWNTHTARNNKRGGRKPGTAQSSWRSLTDVVRNALRREASVTR